MTNAIARRAAALMVASILTLGLAGCASPVAERTPRSPVAERTATETPSTPERVTDARAALDEYVAFERSDIPAILVATGDTYSEITIDPEYPATIVYTYTYAQFVDPVEGAAYFDGQIHVLQQAFDSGVFPTMRNYGVEGTSYAVFTYLNPDGSVIWTHKISSS